MVLLLQQQQHIMSNIYSDEIKNIKNGIGCIGNKDANKLYTQLMNQWDTQRHSVWTSCRQTNRLVGMTIGEFSETVGSSFAFQFANNNITCDRFNNGETVAPDGRNWFHLVVQPVKNRDKAIVRMDAVSLLVLGLMVDGFVFHFAHERHRDAIWCKINNKCYACKLRSPLMGTALCRSCEKTPKVPVIRSTIKMEQGAEWMKDPEAARMVETAIQLTEAEMREDIMKKRLPTEVERMLEQIKKEDEERMAKEWGDWLIKNEPEPVKVVVKPRNPPKDPNRKNIPAKPPAFVRTPAGCQISNHLAVKKWMDKYGNK